MNWRPRNIHFPRSPSSFWGSSASFPPSDVMSWFVQIPFVWTHLRSEIHVTTQSCTIWKCTHPTDLRREWSVSCTMFRQINSASLLWNVNTTCDKQSQLCLLHLRSLSVFVRTLTSRPWICVNHKINTPSKPSGILLHGFNVCVQAADAQRERKNHEALGSSVPLIGWSFL